MRRRREGKKGISDYFILLLAAIWVAARTVLALVWAFVMVFMVIWIVWFVIFIATYRLRNH